MGYVVLEFAGQLFSEGERLRQGTPWLSSVPQTCLNLLQISNCVLTGGQCGKFQMLAELAEVAETGFVCPGGGGQYGQVVQGVKLLTCSCVSVDLAHSCVRVASAHGCVGAALPHSCVSVPLAYGCVSVASAHSFVSANGIGVGCLFACGAREKKT